MSENAQHTAGPWTYSHEPGYGDIQTGELQNVSIDSPRARDGFVMSACSCCNGIECTEADARLIAAAPELLAACRATASALRSHQAYDKSPLGLVEAAIAKATGKS